MGNFITDRIGRLRWKLTLTYTLATVGTLLVVELLAFAALLVLLLPSGVNINSLLPEIKEAIEIYHAPSLRVLLEDPDPDPQNMTDWLERFEKFPTSLETIEGIPSMIEPGTLRALIVGRDGQFLGMSRPDMLEDQVVNEPFNPTTLPGSSGPLRAALAGERDIEQLFKVVEDTDRVIMAVPIWDTADKQVLGALVLWVKTPSMVELIAAVGALLLVSLFFFTIVTAITGTGFGWLAARGLVRRIDRLSQASEAWSQGDFSTQVDDRSRDELGKLSRRLNEMAEQLQQLLETRRDLVVAEERNRLARDLHDSVKQQAFAAASQLGTARRLLDQNPEAAVEHIDEAQELTDGLRRELTSLIQELRPMALDGQGLVGAIHAYATDWSKHNGITLKVQVEDERPLSSDTEQTLFRILQEALANIARHSQAESAEISLTFEKTDVTCTISDNGIGFIPEDIRDGFGLHSMQERVNILGGTWKIESAEGKGTCITITIPTLESPIATKETVRG